MLEKEKMLQSLNIMVSDLSQGIMKDGVNFEYNCGLEVVYNDQYLRVRMKVNPIQANFKINVFRSPEHKVLMVSFCDRPMSVVRRPSCVVHNFFKHLLLLNHWASLDETW